MDPRRFDELTKHFVGQGIPSRRTLLKRVGALIAAGTAAVVVSEPVGAVCRADTAICRKNGDCCSNYCGPADNTGRQRCECGDRQNDVNNCSSCGNACGANQVCCSGVCTDLQTNSSNCGTCGNACPSGSACVEGECACSYSAGGATVDVGQMFIQTCNDGVVTTTSDEPDGDDFEADELVEFIYPDGDSLDFDTDDGPDDGEFEADALVSQTTCVARSRMFDVAGLTLTKWEMFLAFRYNGSRIVGLGRRYAKTYTAPDGWYRDTPTNLYLYSKTRTASGTWVRQGMEGWVGMQWFIPGYGHTHHMILWVNRFGGCWAEDQYEGAIVGLGSRRVDVRYIPYQSL